MPVSDAIGFKPGYKPPPAPAPVAFSHPGVTESVAVSVPVYSRTASVVSSVTNRCFGKNTRSGGLGTVLPNSIRRAPVGVSLLAQKKPEKTTGLFNQMFVKLQVGGGSAGPLEAALGDNLLSLNRFEEAFGPEFKDKDDKMRRAINKTDDHTRENNLETLAEVHTWVKIAGKNGIEDAALREKFDESMDAVVAHLDEHFPGAGFVFDGDNNETNAPFSQLIRRLVIEGRTVVAVEDQARNTSPEHGRFVTESFFNGWMPGSKMSNKGPQLPLSHKKTCTPCVNYPNFFFLLLRDKGKETLTRTLVAGSVFLGSALAQFHLRPKKSEEARVFTTGYAEVVRLFSETTSDNRFFSNLVHELLPESPGLVVVAHHGMHGFGKIFDAAFPEKDAEYPSPKSSELYAAEEALRAEVEAIEAAEAAVAAVVTEGV